MANPRGTFAKRNREMKLKDRAREKAERRASRPADGVGDTKGPQIAWDQPGGLPLDANDPAPPAETTDTPPAGSDKE